MLLSITFHFFNKTSCCCIFLFALLCASPSCHHAAVHNFLLLHFSYSLLSIPITIDCHPWVFICCCVASAICTVAALLFHHTAVPILLALHSPQKITQAAAFSHAPLLHTILVFIYFTQCTTVQFLWLSAATHILRHPVCIKNLLSMFFFMHFFTCCIA